MNVEKQAKKFMKGAKSNWNKAKRTYICRSLKDLIKAYRACTTRSQERALVKKEAAHIRDLFRQGDKHYRRRNIAKLLFFHMNGYPTDFGITECIKLCASKDFSDKRVAYLGMMILVDETEQVLMLMTNSLKQDLNRADVAIIALALHVLGDIGSMEMMRELMPDIETHMRSPNPHIRKKAGLAAVRTVRKLSTEETANILEFTPSFFETRSSAVHVSGAALVAALCAQSAENIPILQATVLPIVLSILNDHATGSAPSRKADLYGSTHDAGNAFLVSKLLANVRLLIEIGAPADVQADVSRLLKTFAAKCNDGKIRSCAILYECVRTSEHVHGDDDLRKLVLDILGRFLVHKEATVRYIALKELTRFADVNGPQELKTIALLNNNLLAALHEADVTVSKQAVDVIYRTTDARNVEGMVSELCEYVRKSGDAETMRDACEKMVLLAERLGPSEEWKVDTFITSLSLGHAVVSAEFLSCFVAMVSKKHAIRSHSVVRLYHEILQPFLKARISKGEKNLLDGGVVTAEDEVFSEIVRKPRVEAVALYVVGEYADLAIQAGIAPDELINAFEAIVEVSDDEENRSMGDVGQIGVSGLMKIAARFSSGSSASGGGGGGGVLDGLMGGLDELVGDVIAPSASTQLVVSDGARSSGLELVGYDADLTALDALSLNTGTKETALTKYEGPNGHNIIENIREKLRRLTLRSRDMERQQRGYEYVKMLESGFGKTVVNVMGGRPDMEFTSVADVIGRKRSVEIRTGFTHGGDGGGLLVDFSDDAADTGGGPGGASAAGRELDDVLGIAGIDDILDGGGGGGGGDDSGGGMLMDLLALPDVSHTSAENNQSHLKTESTIEHLSDLLPQEEETRPLPSPSKNISTVLLETDEVCITATLIDKDVESNDDEGRSAKSVTTWTMQMENLSDKTLSDCVLQLAVPKYMQLTMDAASGSDMNAYGKIEQVVHLVNNAHGMKAIQLRFRVQWRGESDDGENAGNAGRMVRHEGVLSKLEIS